MRMPVAVIPRSRASAREGLSYLIVISNYVDPAAEFPRHREGPAYGQAPSGSPRCA